MKSQKGSMAAPLTFQGLKQWPEARAYKLLRKQDAFNTNPCVFFGVSQERTRPQTAYSLLVLCTGPCLLNDKM